MGSGIEPGKSSSHGLHLQLLILQKLLVHRCDFQLTTSRWLNMLGYFHDLVRIEIQAYHSIVTLRMFRLLFDAQAIALLIEFSHTISFRVTYTITKDGSFAILLGIYYSLMQHLTKTSTMEDVVTQYKTSRIITNELLTDDECLCQAIRRRLLSILELHSKLTTIT